jgi:hypothetical protein
VNRSNIGLQLYNFGSNTMEEVLDYPKNGAILTLELVKRAFIYWK